MLAENDCVLLLLLVAAHVKSYQHPVWGPFPEQHGVVVHLIGSI
jgi:hypothetical protein